MIREFLRRGLDRLRCRRRVVEVVGSALVVSIMSFVCLFVLRDVR